MKSNNELMDKEEAKTLLLYMLKELYEITEQNNISIYASGGTCLGAVRHRGMIPWDDDIDLMIFRKDYDRLTSLCENCLQKPLVLRTRENDPLFCQEFAKLCFLDDDGNYSDLSIDIFELDETEPKRALFRELQNSIKKCMYFIKRYKVSQMGYDDFYPSSAMKRFVLQIGCLLPISLIDKLQRWAMTAEKKNCDYVVNWGAAYSYKRATYPKKAFGVPKKMCFENTYVWAAEHPEMILERLYGKNYMQLPPVEKRTDHGIRAFKCSSLDMKKIREEVRL